jgi:hypothetical protein
VWNCYGKKSNFVLLLNYGFVVPGNPYKETHPFRYNCAPQTHGQRLSDRRSVSIEPNLFDESLAVKLDILEKKNIRYL